MKSEWMARQDLRFDASLGADERDLVSGFGRDLRQYQGRHEVPSSTSARNQDLHEIELCFPSPPNACQHTCSSQRNNQ